MSQKHIEVVQSIYAGWGAGDFSFGPRDFDPHVMFVVRPTFPEPGVFVGAAEISGYMRTFLAQFEPGSVSIKANRLLPAGDTVLADVVQIGAGRASGVETDLRYFMLFTFRADKIVRIESILNEADALEAAGLSD